LPGHMKKLTTAYVTNKERFMVTGVSYTQSVAYRVQRKWKPNANGQVPLECVFHSQLI
jgi:hypothetical protein